MRRPLHSDRRCSASAWAAVVAGCGSDDNSSSSRLRLLGFAATSTPAAKKPIKVGLVTDIGGLQRPLVQPARQRGARAGASRSSASRSACSRRSPTRDYVPNLSTLAQQKYDLVIGVGFLMADAMNTVASKFPDTKFAIIDVDAVDAQGQAQERPGPALQGAGGGLPRRLPGRPVHQGQGRRAGHRLRRRPEDPAGRPLHRRLPGRRQGGQPGRSRRSTATRRSSSTRRSARSSRSTRSSRARRSCSRWPASAASARSTRPRRRACRGSASTPTRPTSAPQVMTSAIKKVDVAVVRHRQGGAGRRVQGWDEQTSTSTNGAGIGKTTAAGQKYARRSRRCQKKIADGSITDIPDTVK